MRSPSSIRWIGIAGVLAALSAADAGAGLLLCGVVRSGGAAVRGANLVVLERGATAVTDSSGSFCFDLAEPGVVTVRAYAVGFEPGERVVSATGTGATVRLELTPLRGSSGGPLGDVPTSPGVRGVEVLETSPSPGQAQDDARGKLREQFMASLPVLLLPADSSWLLGKHKGAHWDSLFVLHDRLRGRGMGDAALDPGAWRKLNDRLEDLYLPWCADERPRKHSFGDAPCAYLNRGIALTEARTAALTAKPLSRNTRVYLQRLAGSGDPRVAAWARLVLARVPVGPPSGLPPPPAAPSPVSGSQGDRPGN